MQGSDHRDAVRDSIRREENSLCLNPALPLTVYDHVCVTFPHKAGLPICKIRARGQIISEVLLSSEIDKLVFSNVSLMKMRMSGPMLPDVAGRSNGQLIKNLIWTKLLKPIQLIPIIYRRGALLDLITPKERISTNFSVTCVSYSSGKCSPLTSLCPTSFDFNLITIFNRTKD